MNLSLKNKYRKKICSIVLGIELDKKSDLSLAIILKQNENDILEKQSYVQTF